MIVDRTIRLRLPDEQVLYDTLKEFSRTANTISEVAWEHKEKNRFRLHHLVYKDIRQNSTLTADLTVACIGKVSGAIKRAVNKPVFKEHCSVRYSRNKSYSIKLKERTCSISTIKGRFKTSFSLPDYYLRYVEWETMGAELVCDYKNRLWLNVVVSKKADAVTTSCSPIHNRGIDLGINNLAVTSDGRFYKGVSNVLRKMWRLRSSLQSKGTKSAKRHLKILSRRQRLYMRDVNHRIAKQIVGEMSEGSSISMENLKGIRNESRGKKLNRLLSNWSFYEFRMFLTYKAEEKNIPVVLVKAKNTSKTCSVCGQMGTRKRGFFQCSCGHSINADLNGARNILARLNPTGNERMGVVNPPIVAICV